MLQNATPLRNSAPGPPNSSDEHVSCTKSIFADPRQMSHACHRFWKCHKTLTFLLTFDKVHNPLRLPRESTSERPKVARTWCALYILTSTCASRHNGVHFFDSATFKSAPKLKCFVHFDLEMRIAPQRVHVFDISTSKSGPNLVCFVHFDFEMCCAPKTACIFSSLICPAGSAPAALASLLFDPPEPQIIGKTQWFVTFLPSRAPASSFFWLFLSSLIFVLLLFSSLTLPTSAFPSVHSVGSLTSKLPSIINRFIRGISLSRTC